MIAFSNAHAPRQVHGSLTLADETDEALAPIHTGITQAVIDVLLAIFTCTVYITSLIRFLSRCDLTMSAFAVPVSLFSPLVATSAIAFTL
jgi:hypothetical protein